MTQAKLQEVETIALGFAQALSTSSLSNAQISIEAMKLALDWVESADEREKLYTQHYPKWELLNKDCKFLFEKGKKYWISYIESDERHIDNLEFYENSYYMDEHPFIFVGKDKLAVKPDYFIKPENAEFFDKDFQPYSPNPKDFIKKERATPFSPPPSIKNFWG